MSRNYELYDPEDYVYCSARDNIGEKGIVEGVIVAE
jgi:hypothetical protein